MSVKISTTYLSEAIFDSISEGILVADLVGNIQMVNPRMEEMFGYKRIELLGKPVETLVPDHIKGRHTEHRESFNQNPTKRPMGIGLHLEGQRKDGSLFPIEISLNHIRVKDRPLIVALISDITERAQILASLKQERELTASYQKEKELNEMKTRFVSMASHEFRTPLTSILSSAELIDQYIQKGKLENTEKHIKRVQKSVHHLTDILSDFLSLEQFDQGKVKLKMELVQPIELFHQITEKFEPILKENQTIKIESDKLPIIKTDKNVLSIILNNIISNAIKYSPKNSTVKVIANVIRERLEIQCIDEGMGIPKKDLEGIFDRFNRGSNVNNIEGTGLGLNIVKRYVELLEGTISIQSKEDEGTTVSMKIPVL